MGGQSVYGDINMKSNYIYHRQRLIDTNIKVCLQVEDHNIACTGNQSLLQYCEPANQINIALIQSYIFIITHMETELCVCS